MTDASILGMAGSFIGVCGVLAAATMSKRKYDSVSIETCNAKHEALNKSLDGVWKATNTLNEKVDRVLIKLGG